nr:HD domain-containing protein [Helcococcus sueciensis]
MKSDKSLDIAEKIAKKVNINGGRAYFVGGYVRDEYRLKFGQTNNIDNDIDIEIHGIEKNDLEKILNEFGDVLEIGKSFGIYTIRKYNLDIALPRIETKSGEKHTDFDIEVDPFIGTYKSSERRDFTINSIMKDILTGEYIDHFNGIEDIENGILRFVNGEKFQEDPLRVLRACQFAARFGYKIDKETIELCKNIDIRNLSKERVYEEVNKGLFSSNPSIFFKYMDKMNHLNYWFKELFHLQEIDQSQKFHAEGNVYNHTLMVLDEGSKLLDRVNYKKEFMYALLCHDFGKYTATSIENGKIHSYKHEEEGIPLAKTFLRRLTDEKFIVKYVINMTLLHMKPNMYARDKSKIKSTNRVFFDSIDPNDLILLSIADDRGRISLVEKENSEDFLYDRLEIFNEYMSRDYVEGKDLIENGIKSGPIFRKLLELRDKHRISGVSKNESLKQIIAYNKELESKNEN